MQEIVFKENRPRRDVTFAMMAKVTSLRGTCLRAKVGAVIVKDNRVISMGYNGALPGGEHCTDETCTSDQPCKNTVHAEANAIYYAARAGISTHGATIYCTHSPCQKCSEAIIQAGIERIVFITEYRETNWLLLKDLQIDIIDETSVKDYFKTLSGQ